MNFAFFRGVGFFALGTSLCLPFFTKGLVESRGLCAILSCCHRGFFWADVCFWTTGSPPPTTHTGILIFHQVMIACSPRSGLGNYLNEHYSSKQSIKWYLSSQPVRITGLASCLAFWDCCFFSRVASMFPMSSCIGTLLFFPEAFSLF